MSPKHTKFLPWDSEFFARKIATVALRADGVTSDVSVERAVKESAGAGIECLTLLLDANDQPAIFAAAAHGFALVDVRMTLKAELTVSPTPHPVTVRAFRPADLAAMEKLALTSFSTTRFAVDPHFPKTRAAELYRIWAVQNAESKTKLTLVALEKNAFAGFISCGAHPLGGSAIELLAVDSAVRGKGVGNALVQAAMKHYAGQAMNEMRVVTQARNIKAMTFYQSAGFKVETVEFSFHKWFEMKSRAAA